MVRLTLPVRKALTSTAKARDRAARTLLPRDPCDAHARRIVLASIALACASLAAAQAPPTEPPATTKSTPASTPATGPTAAGAPPSTTTVPLGIARADAYAEFRRLYDLKEFDAAAKQGQRVVELIESDPSATSDELQVALMNLAAAQSFAQDYIGAEATYQRVIGLLETEGKVGSSRMARATAGLAGVYSSEKRYELAVPAYERALTMSRRAEGLFNEEQLPLLDGYAESLTEMGDYQQALQAYSYGLRVAERRFGAESQQIVERLEDVGRWYTRIGALRPGPPGAASRRAHRREEAGPERDRARRTADRDCGIVPPPTARSGGDAREQRRRPQQRVPRCDEPADAIARAGPARGRGRACAHARGADR
jgi:tetratricopeptide (TPR) repeat protein